MRLRVGAGLTPACGAHPGSIARGPTKARNHPRASCRRFSCRSGRWGTVPRSPQQTPARFRRPTRAEKVGQTSASTNKDFEPLYVCEGQKRRLFKGAPRTLSRAPSVCLLATGRKGPGGGRASAWHLLQLLSRKVPVQADASSTEITKGSDLAGPWTGPANSTWSSSMAQETPADSWIGLVWGYNLSPLL